MQAPLTRRRWLRLASQGTAAGFLGVSILRASARRSGPKPNEGLLCGQSCSDAVGRQMFAAGGNVVDAVVAAALASAVVTPARCGIGGYGGFAILALARRKKVVALDFNSAAPQAARPDMYPLDAQGEVRGKENFYGWKAAGVPATLAGLQKVLDRYGKLSFREVVQPAIAAAREGVPMGQGLAKMIQGLRAQFARDPASARLYLEQVDHPSSDHRFRNPDLAALLETLAARGAVRSFYQGDIARQIADGYARNGGLVTARDLAAYEAREVKPLHLRWNGLDIHTVPLTAGGLSVFEALGFLKALEWETWPAGPQATHAWVEALQMAWSDRLTLLGDPAHVRVPTDRLLSPARAREVAEDIRRVVRERRRLPLQTAGAEDGGTVNISGADAEGNIMALTLSHGGGFGARVTVPGLGLTLGHAMSRFDPHPNHPNAPGPGKRPLVNMCPTVVFRDGVPVLAVGGAGGVRIPNAIYQVLTQYVGRERSMEEAVLAPRLHTTGTKQLAVEKGWPGEEADALRALGYEMSVTDCATASAVARHPVTGVLTAQAQ